MVVVEARVEEAVVAGVPHAAATRIRDPVGQFLAAGDIAHAQREEFRTLVVEGPEQLVMVGRMVDAAETEVGLAFGFRVAVEHDLVGAAVARRAEVTRLLAAQPEGRAIGIGAILHRHGGIVLLDAPLHLGEQLAPQLGRVGHQRRLVGILGLEMGADRAVEQ